MKISIVTISFNSAATIRDTIESVLSQDYPDIEYIIKDGGSKDDTLKIIKSFGNKIKLVSQPDKGIYDAMSQGVALATGEVVGIINSDDFYPDNQVIRRVAEAFNKHKTDAIYGDLQYVDYADKSKIVRDWKSGEYQRGRFLNGWMPPHPTFFLKKSVYDKFGLYDASFKSAGDYELMLRMLYKHQVSVAYIPHVQMLMRTGGVSNVTLKNRIRANQEDRRAWKINGLKPRFYTLFAKPLSKLGQFLKL
jgi:glycosyltransferase involved in cell wall biosynthesis